MTQNQNSMPEMRLNPVTLSFKGDCRHLEQEFLDDYAAKSLNHIRIALLLSTFLYAAFGFLDAQLVPDHKAQLWFIRYAIMCPSLLVGVLLTFWSRFHKYMQGCIAVLIVMGGFGIIIMVAIAPPSGQLFILCRRHPGIHDGVRIHQGPLCMGHHRRMDQRHLL